MPDRIFVSYRREDTQQAAGRLFDRLVERFGDAEVFRDIDRIPAGVNFGDHIIERLKRCDVVLVLIGQRWLAPSGGLLSFWRSRLHNKNDWVRQEIEVAIRTSVPIVPVLIDDAPMPNFSALPKALRPLATKNAVKLRDNSYGHDLSRLTETIDDKMGSHKRRASMGGDSGQAVVSPETIRLGVNLGHLLAELEVYEGVSNRPGFEFAKGKAETARHQIMALLKIAKVDDSVVNINSADLISDVLRTISVTNSWLHAAALIGIATARIKLARGSETEEQRIDLENTAQEGLEFISPGLPLDKAALFSALLKSDCSITAASGILKNAIEVTSKSLQ